MYFLNNFMKNEKLYIVTMFGSPFKKPWFVKIDFVYITFCGVVLCGKTSGRTSIKKTSIVSGNNKN